MSSVYVLNSKAFWAITMLGGMALFFICMMLVEERSGVVATIRDFQDRHRKGLVTDSIDVYLSVELARSSTQKFLRTGAPLLALAFGIPTILSVLATQVWPKLMPAYNFYWGDYVSKWDKKQSVLRTIWVVGVLGLVVSVLATGVSRYLWP
jgi:hypothetical protein